MHKILVACGTGTATAAVVADALGKALRTRGLGVEFTLGAIADVAGLAPGHDLVVSTMPISDAGGVTVVHTLAFLTGVETEAAVDRIEALLRSERAR